VREGWLALLLLLEDEQSSGLIPISSTLETETEAAVESFTIVNDDGDKLF